MKILTMFANSFEYPINEVTLKNLDVTCCAKSLNRLEEFVVVFSKDLLLLLSSLNLIDR